MIIFRNTLSLYTALKCFFNPSESIGVSMTKQMEFECELRDGERDINFFAACSVGVGDGVGSGTTPKKSQNVYVITVQIGVPNSIGA